MATPLIKDKDIRRICAHLVLHYEKPQTEPIRGLRLAWAYVRFAMWAIPILIYHGYICPKREEVRIPGEEARKKKDAG